MAWQDAISQAAGAQAPEVIRLFQQIDPNYDWTRAAGLISGASQSIDGYLDPNRTSGAQVVKSVLQNLGQFDQNEFNRDLPYLQSGNLDSMVSGEAGNIQKQQASHGGGGFLGMGDLGNLLAIGGLGLTGFGLAGMGPLAGALGGAGAVGANAGIDGMLNFAGGSAGGGMFDLGGGLGLDEFGNVSGGMFQGGPGTAGAGDFFSGGASGLDFGGAGAGLSSLINNASPLAKLLGLGGGGAQGGGLVGGAGRGPGGGGFNLGSLLPLLGIGSGLSTLLGKNTNAVDPNMIRALWGAGQNTYQTAQDPQSDLYGRTLQQVQDQSRAANSAAGVATSPAGVGLENQATRNFNIDWQNQQLQRQLAGLQGFTGAGNTAANAGVANNAQAFMQNQTGLNNLTTGLGQMFGTPGSTTSTPFGNFSFGGTGPNGVGSWLNGLFAGGGGGGGGGSSGGGSGSYNPFPSMG